MYHKAGYCITPFLSEGVGSVTMSCTVKPYDLKNCTAFPPVANSASRPLSFSYIATAAALEACPSPIGLTPYRIPAKRPPQLHCDNKSHIIPGRYNCQRS